MQERRRDSRLVAVNVGQPRELPWRGGTLRSSIVKRPVAGRVWVDRLNVAGDTQADLIGHGGEHRAVFVYQLESHHYWEHFLGRELEGPGQFGENFTVEGLSDEEVCIGDRYAVGSAIFEVTQPRVTCVKVGVRLGEPRMPALLTGHGRPGFYFRVLVPGEVRAGDVIRLVHRETDAPSVRRTSDLLYSSDHDPKDLRRAIAVAALAEGWRTSLQALLEAGQGAGNPGLAGVRETPPWLGFRPFKVAAVSEPAQDVRALTLVPGDGGSVPGHRGGQFVPVRIPGPDGEGRVRSYSLSAAADGQRLRLSVKRVGAVSARVHQLRAGETIELGAPRGEFVTDAGGAQPLALISAGIGVTPLLAILATWLRQGAGGRCCGCTWPGTAPRTHTPRR